MPIRQLKHAHKHAPSGFSSHPLRGERLQPRRRQRVSRSEPPTDFWTLTSLQTEKRHQEHQRHQRYPLKYAVVRFVIRACFIIILVGAISIVSLFWWYSRDLPDPNKIIARDIAQSTKIYDRTGTTLLYEIHGAERRTLIELSSIPRYVIDATVAIEDKNFYEHRGFSMPHLVKAVALEILSKLGLYRGMVPGGSTLTQQLIKNAILTTEKSYERKVKELVLANRMEQKFTKEEILKLYFNEIPYGSTAYGIEAASHIYFDKSAKDLTLAEAAVLAAMPQAPSYYSPYGSHKDELVGRQRYILDLTVEQGYITEEQARAAKEEELTFKKRREDIKAPHFVFMVKEELSARYGERLIEQGGLKITTTLDVEKQKAAEETIAAFEQKNLETYEAQNASLVTIAVNTGEVLALVGSKDFFNEDIEGQVNVATSPRQPGSSLKPVIYAEAFNRGYRPDTIVYDLVTSFAAAGKDYRPHNYDGKEHGPVTLRQALQGSLNIPAVKVLYLVGAQRAVELAQELGYTTLTDPDRYGLSLVLGGGEVKLIEHTNAYAVFAREGVFKPYVAVLKVEDSSGNVLEEHRDNEGKRVLPREIARTLNSVLTDNEARAFIFGVNNHLTLSGRPAAAKTGTTNDYRDAWTIGYTPSIVTGVWIGNSRNEAMKRGADGSVLAAPIWQQYMNTILKAMPIEIFKSPPALLPCDKPMFCGGRGEQKVKINIETGKRASAYTPLSKIREVSYQEARSILHYVDRNDPAGPIPEHPEQDPQYYLWEEPVQRWAEENDYTSQQPPSDIDDLYKPEDQPVVTWIMPKEAEVITLSPYTFEVNATSRRGVTRVEYFLNDVVVGSSSEAPFRFSFAVSPMVPNGAYRLTAVATDDIGNEQRSSVAISIDVPRGTDEWYLSWKTPTEGVRYQLSNVPDHLVLTVSHPEQLAKIDFYYESGGARSYVGFSEVNNQPELIQDWIKPAQPGLYRLLLIVTDRAATVFQVPGISIEILSDASP